MQARIAISNSFDIARRKQIFEVAQMSPQVTSSIKVFAIGLAGLLTCLLADGARAQPPNIRETKAIAEEGFIYGLPLVMNYGRARNQQQDYPERTGIPPPTERYCGQFRAMGASRDPAPPA
jgi:hypothetical protein